MASRSKEGAARTRTGVREGLRPLLLSATLTESRDFGWVASLCAKRDWIPMVRSRAAPDGREDGGHDALRAIGIEAQGYVVGA